MSALFTQTELLRSLVIFFLLGSIAGLLMGVLMLWRPTWFARISKMANSWVSTRQMARPLGKAVNIDHWVYRYSLVSGGLLVAGAIYIVVMFVFKLTRTQLLTTLAKLNLLQPAWNEPVLDTLVFIFIAGAILALFVGLFLIFRPSMLRDMELGANEQVPMRTSLKPMEIQYNQLDGMVSRHVKLVGVVLIGASLYVLVMLIFWLAK
jgi:uncharacterized integral membrane protein